MAKRMPAALGFAENAAVGWTFSLMTVSSQTHSLASHLRAKIVSLPDGAAQSGQLTEGDTTTPNCVAKMRDMSHPEFW